MMAYPDTDKVRAKRAEYARLETELANEVKRVGQTLRDYPDRTYFDHCKAALKDCQSTLRAMKLAINHADGPVGPTRRHTWPAELRDQAEYWLYWCDCADGISAP